MNKLSNGQTAEELFRRIVEGEPWADRITYTISSKYRTPHLAYDAKAQRGYFRSPPYSDPLIMAEWYAHECGHLECYDHYQPSKFASWADDWIRTVRFRLPNWLYRLLLNAYYLLFCRHIWKKETYASQVEGRLLKKIGLPLSVAEQAEKAADQLASDLYTPVIGAKLLRHYMRKAMAGRMKTAYEHAYVF